MMDLKKLGLASAAIVAGALMALPVSARERDRARDMSSPRSSMSQPSSQAIAFETMDAKKLLGMDIIGTNGDKVGTLNNVAVHQDGRIAYGVLTHGGFVGIDEKYIAVPWKALQLSTDNKGKQVLSINLSKDALDAAQGFDKSNWPLQPTLQVSSLSGSDVTSNQGVAMNKDISSDNSFSRSQDLDRDVDSYGYVGDKSDASKSSSDYGASRDMSRSSSDDMDRSYDRSHAKLPDAYVANGQLVRLDKLIGWKVDNQNQKIGEVKNFVIDMRNGHLAYALVDFNDTIKALNDRKAVVPWEALSLVPSDKAVAFKNGVDVNTLQAVSFTGNQLPDLNDQAYAQRLHTQFNVEPYWQTFGYMGDETRDMGHQMKKDIQRGYEDTKDRAHDTYQDLTR